jgi:hypothetical protein
MRTACSKDYCTKISATLNNEVLLFRNTIIAWGNPVLLTSFAVVDVHFPSYRINLHGILGILRQLCVHQFCNFAQYQFKICF